MKQILSQIGLHEHEQRIYLSLLEIGSSSVSNIVDATRLHRPTVYKHLKTLEEKRLIQIMYVGKRKFFSAVSPERLKVIAETIPNRVESLLPELLKKFEYATGKPKVQWFEGDKVITWIYQDVLDTCKKGDIVYRYESPKDYTEIDAYLPPEYFERFCKKKEVEKYVITNEKTAKTKPRVLERVSKFVPTSFDIFEYDITQIIYGDKVAFIDVHNNTGWIVENSMFAHFQRQLFRLLFKRLD